VSILSKEPDGMGWYYGFYESDPRQINVRELHKGQWYVNVGDDCIANRSVVPNQTCFATKDEAEAAAIAFLKTGRRT
jgi:hypothetical protein